MKKWMILFILFAWVNNAAAQADSIYKYFYTFSQVTKSNYSSNVVTTNNTSGLSSISVDIVEKSKRNIKKGAICLGYFDEIFWCALVKGGKFDTTINPGFYELSAGKQKKLYAFVRFSIDANSHVQLNIALKRTKSLNVYEIHSQKQLDKKEIRRIKKSVIKNYNTNLFGSGKVYYVIPKISL